MTTLLKIEFRKNLSYPTFWALLGFYLVFLLLAVYSLQGMDFQTQTEQGMQEVSLGYYAFPMVWQTVSYIAGYMGLFLAILVIINITNEFSFRTLRQSVINGQSRMEFLLSKLFFVLIISVLAAIWVMGVSWFIGQLNTENIAEVKTLENIKWILAAFVQILGYLSLAIFVGTLLKNTGIAVFLYLAYAIVAERIFWLLPDNIDRFLPAKSLNTLIPFPVPTDMIPEEIQQQGGIPMLPDQAFSSVEIMIALVWITLFWAGSYWLINKRDL